MTKTKATPAQAARFVTKPRNSTGRAARKLPKALTGIQGLDEITLGGLPRGRPTLICGSAGCGKTLFAMEFLVHGARDLGEPGVFIAFEENADDLTTNVRSLGFDLDDLVAKKKLVVDFVRVERHEIEETGDYDLEGLFVRMAYAIDSIGAKRIVLDTLETLFSGFTNEAVLRAELRRLFRWLKDKGITAVVTGERGSGQLTRHGLEEYVSDCVILLDHRVVDQVSTRHLRIVKYRGTTHGTNEYPFLIDQTGISVVPITSVGLSHQASNERVSTGIAELDRMLGGKGYFRTSTILISGGVGNGKTSFASQFVQAACQRGDKCLYLSFEESRDQIVRNMRSIGLDLVPCEKKGLLQFHSVRAAFQGLEMHFAEMHRLLRTFEPDVVVLDPFDSLAGPSSERETVAIMTKLIDLLKMRGITALLLQLADRGDPGSSLSMVSSLVDTWIELRDVDAGDHRSRLLRIVKSRGMPHSNEVRAFRLTNRGVRVDPTRAAREQLATGGQQGATR